MNRLNIKFLILIVTSIASVFATGCKKHNNHKPFSLDQDIDIPSVNIQRLDKEIEGYINLDSTERVAMIDSNLNILKGFGLFLEGNDRVDNTTLAFWSTWPPTVMFMPEVNRLYPDLKTEEKAFGRILETARENGIEVPAENFVAVVWGDQRSIMIMDTIKTAYIALNHYLGPLNEAYNGWAEYKRNLKTRDMIPVDMAEALISTARPYNAAENPTILSRLLYEGALAVAKQAMVPNASTAMILGFIPDDFAKIVENESFMWQKLNNDNILYSTDGALSSNLFSFRPNSTLISPNAPGRAIRYIGYKIVSDYLDNNPDKGLDYILSPEFYNNGVEVLRAARYMPKEH